MSNRAQSRRAMQIKALLSMGMLVGLGAVSTLAAWTGTATATSAPITAAKVSLGVGATADNASSYTVPINGSNWYPGMSQALPVVVKNTSTLALPYSITGSVTENAGGGLGQALHVVVTAGTVTGTAPNVSCTGTPLVSKAALASFPAPVVRPSSLAPEASETLCVQYSLPATANTALQGNSTTVKLTFTATVGS
ncbi:SipW-dependent-type signal peptide-containing protein [Specibacter sp. NPDC057265]|uniref:SipW-dependent-type signal peptide-containing protein n=1 Tax=Specibacter sp. NPDC057265 TaxID=3346075 RepID=UPI003643E4E6